MAFAGLPESLVHTSKRIPVKFIWLRVSERFAASLERSLENRWPFLRPLQVLAKSPGVWSPRFWD